MRKVGQCLQRTGLSPDLLCIELTESLFLGRSLASVRSVLDEIRALGVALALDDFGTGYSSLAYLSQLPFDKLKIDQSFVNGAHTSARRREMLRSIIDMAHSLGMRVVAEGAEDEGEVALLKALCADEIQGFFLSRPQKPEHIASSIARIEGSGFQASA